MLLMISIILMTDLYSHLASIYFRHLQNGNRKNFKAFNIKVVDLNYRVWKKKDQQKYDPL